VGFNGAVLSQIMNPSTNERIRPARGAGARMRTGEAVLGHSETADDCFYRVSLQLGLECEQRWTRVNQMRRLEILPSVKFRHKLFVSYVNPTSMENHIELVSNDTNSFVLELENRTIAVMWPNKFFNQRFELAHYNFYANSNRQILHHDSCLRPLRNAFRGIVLSQWGPQVASLFAQVAQKIDDLETYESPVGRRLVVTSYDNILSCRSVTVINIVTDEIRAVTCRMFQLLLLIMARLQALQHIDSSTVGFDDSFALSVNACDCGAQ